MKREQIITILADKEAEAARKKGKLGPFRRSEYLARRLRQGDFVQFYDLASWNNGTRESPDWKDHPILKTPSFSTSIVTETPSGNFRGVTYTIDLFESADFDAMIQMFFDKGPVSEWRNIYRKLEWEQWPGYPDTPAPVYQTTYPTTLRIRTPPHPSTNANEHLLDNYTDETIPIFASERDFHLTFDGFAWYQKGMEYAGFGELSHLGLTTRDWFSGSTARKSSFKLTATYDPDAPDVDDLTITGPIDCYLVPLPACFMAAGALSEPENRNPGFNVLGPWYQILPRHQWPAYRAPYTYQGDVALQDDFLDYQKARTGAQASTWTVTGSVGSFILSSSVISPPLWDSGIFGYQSATLDNGAQRFFSSGTWTIPAAAPGGNAFWQRSDPLLMCVFKIGGAFYYCWSLDGNAITNEAAGTAPYFLSYDPSP